MQNLPADRDVLRRQIHDDLIQHQRGQRPPPTARELFARVLACHVTGSRDTRPAALVAAEQYANDPALLKALAAPGMIGKAAIGPALTTQTGWASDLTSPLALGTLQLAAPNSVYSQLSQRASSIRTSLAGHGSARVPARAPITPSSPFIGEGAPIKLRQGGISAATLLPHKAAIISTCTLEMLNRSPIEQLIRDVLAYDTSVALDSVLLDNIAGDTIRPPGLLNGVTPTTATIGGGLAAFAGDVRALAAAIEATGPMADPVLLMSATSSLLMQTLAQGGEVPIIAAPSVPAKMLIMVDAANFASAEGDSPDIATSREAVLHEEDTTPLPIVGGTAQPPVIGSIAAPVRSMFSTACVALRLLQDVTWCMSRVGRVASITTVTW